MPQGSLAQGFELLKLQAQGPGKIIKQQFFTNPDTGEVTLAVVRDDGSVDTTSIGFVGTRFKDSKGQTVAITDNELTQAGFDSTDITIFRNAETQNPDIDIDPIEFLRGLRS